MIYDFGIWNAECGIEGQANSTQRCKGRRRRDFSALHPESLSLCVEFPRPSPTSAKQQHNDNDDEQETDPAAANPDGTAKNR
jgi:hypothetical protein